MQKVSWDPAWGLPGRLGQDVAVWRRHSSGLRFWQERPGAALPLRVLREQPRQSPLVQFLGCGGRCWAGRCESGPQQWHRVRGACPAARAPFLPNAEARSLFRAGTLASEPQLHLPPAAGVRALGTASALVFRETIGRCLGGLASMALGTPG